MARIVTDYLDETVIRYPNKIAFSDDKQEVTFLCARDMSTRIATWMIKEGAFKCPVGIYLGKGVDVIISFMGCAYSGNFYSPIDPNMPKERAKSIINTLQPQYIITNQELCEEAKKIAGNAQIVTLEALYSVVVSESLIIERKNKIIDTDVLYVFFTSGSTGIPKGVIISHRAVIDYAEWVNKVFEIDNTVIFGNQAPFYFDNSILDIFQTIKAGAELNIIPENLFADPRDLLKYIDDKKINFIFWVPSALCIVANSGELNSIHLNSIKKVLFCGEVMPTKQLNLWRKEYPDVKFANLYGPTEIADVCTYYIIDREFKDDEPLPIGYPCENTDVLVLDESNNLIVPNEVDREGELCVRGSCLSYGYYNNPERTEAVFIQNPINTSYPEKIYRTGDIVKYNSYGEITYVGRKDFQIKISGFRVELGEIETAASVVDGIENCCCIFDEKNKHIILLYTGDGNKKTIRSQIRKAIPRYMMPHKYIKIEKMPLNVNGKYDRMKLKKMYIDETE